MIWCDAHGKTVNVANGPNEGYAKKDKLPHNGACRMDIEGAPTVWTLTPDDGDIIRLSHTRRGRQSYMFPHWGTLQAGQRLASAYADSTHPNRQFRRIPLRSGGYYLATTAGPESFYIGIAGDGYLALTSEPHPWFFILPDSS